MPRFAPRSASVAAFLFLCVITHAAERSISTPATGPAFGDQDPAAIAYQGDEGFVVWTDWRGGGTPAAYGSRINAGGTLVDPDGIRLNTTRLPATAQGVVWAGNAWVAVWTENNVIYGRRIAANGTFLSGPVPLLSISGQSQPHVVDVATAGGTIAVAVRTNDASGSGPHIAIANADLTNVRAIASTLAPRKVVSDGSRYYIFGTVPTPGHPARVTPMTPDGQIGEVAPAAIIGNLIDVAWTGRDFIAVADAFVYRISHDLSSVGPPITLFTSGELQALGGADGRAIAIWRDGERIRAAEVGDRTVSPSVILGRSTSFALAPVRVAATRHGYVVAAAGLRTAMVPFDVTLPVVDPLNVAEATRSVAAQSRFAGVRDGTSDLYVFVEADGVRSRVMIGSSRFAPRVLVETGHSQYAPSIASNGRTTLVTWIEEQQGISSPRVMALPVDAEGRSLVFGPIPLGFADHRLDEIWSGNDVGVWPAAVVWTGSVFIVAWDGMIVRVLENGSPLDSPPRQLFPPTTLRRDHISMTRVGGTVLMVWMEGQWSRGCVIGCFPTAIRAVRLNSNGDLATPPVDLALHATAALPEVASNGDIALVVWEEQGVIRATRLAPDGAAAVPVTISPGAGFRPTVARHLDGFIVAWQTNGPAEDTILVARVSRDLFVSAPMIVTREAARAHGPHAWTTTNGTAEIAFAKVAADTGWVPRLFISTFPPSPPARLRAVRR